MRNYFSCNIKGGKLFMPFIIFWLLLAGLILANSIWFAPTSEMMPTIFNWAYIWKWAFNIMTLLLALSAMSLWLYHCTRETIRSTSLEGDSFEPCYNSREYTMMCLKGVLLSTVTLGIYTPWFIKKLTAYFAENTAYRTNFFEFHGKGSSLFIYMVLLVAIPAFLYETVINEIAPLATFAMYQAGLTVTLVFILLVLLICFYEALYIKWYINMTYGRKRIMSSVQCGKAGWFIFGQVLLSGITLCLYLPMATIRIWRYYATRTVIGEDNIEKILGFSMTPKRDYFFILGQMLLTAITLGIYFPWGYARTMSRLIRQTYVETLENTSDEPMPATYN